MMCTQYVCFFEMIITLESMRLNSWRQLFVFFPLFIIVCNSKLFRNPKIVAVPSFPFFLELQRQTFVKNSSVFFHFGAHCIHDKVNAVSHYECIVNKTIGTNTHTHRHHGFFINHFVIRVQGAVCENNLHWFAQLVNIHLLSPCVTHYYVFFLNLFNRLTFVALCLCQNKEKRGNTSFKY